MPTVKEYNVKLVSLRNTRKITKTMKMVSARKMRKAQLMQKNADVFVRKMNGMFSQLALADHTDSNPILDVRPKVRNVLMVVFTSDRGLCGGFNNNLNKTVAGWISASAGSSRKIHMGFCGRRGYLYFRGSSEVRMNFEGITVKPTYGDARRISLVLQETFVSGEFDEIYIAYNLFKSILSQVPVIEKLFPVKLPEQKAPGKAVPGGNIVEPAINEFVDFILPKIASVQVYAALLNNAAGEHGARMNAMDNSTRNTDRLIDECTLLRNRARQASITKELIEVISGAEALK